MKYYAEGKKVRTSDRIYTHAVMHDGELVGCCGSKELARKALAGKIAEWTNTAAGYRARAAAAEAGKTFFTATAKSRGGTRSWKEPLDRSRDEYLAAAEKYEKYADGFYLVELETRD